MVKVFNIVFMTLAFLTFGFIFVSNAEEITNYNDLIENGKELDGSKLSLKGEAIGEPMKRGEYTWVNISDGSTAMGIWMKSSDAERISFYGNNKTKGDKVEITGEFHRACPEHGGDMDIHALSVEIAEKGNVIDEAVDKVKVKSALPLSVLTALLSVAFLKSRKKYLS